MAASKAASQLLNLRSPALQTLLSRHLLHPSATAAASPSLRDAQLLHLFHPENGSNDSPDNSSSARNSNLHVSNFPLYFHSPSGFPVMQIEAARTHVPGDDEDVEEDDDGFDDFDDEADEDDIENYSGSDFDDEDDDEYVDEDDEDANARRPSQK